ncbi:septum formation initiator family protein [Larsenimonas rhizosphaerae]|uniref:Cell division protein FtsB n=1 Tax=Larsenimonas rhizosphaerae TaxID=2944682 RepID=A0AA41ZIK4_9GAMM|nr:septum formation initiator family protein [Larsenimonas rhizosphaerae]MCM2131805.1 septum formation initiator family protein [Larsenimonas rhizosphaerae]MCX2524879.1 septum formation initiator family protein [Larsenimonas rhizosphaerae]
MLKWLSIALVALLGILQYHLWFDEGGFIEWHRVMSRADTLAESNAVLKARNERLAAEVIDLKNGLGAVEERARNDLGMVRGDEQFFWVPGVTVDATEEARNSPPEPRS